MLNYFTYNGKRSIDFGIYIEHSPDSVHAERRGDLLKVAGRNGYIVQEDDTFENYNQTYEVGFKKEFQRDAYQKSSDIANWLLGSSGYLRFEDTYEPEVYRMARFANPFAVNTLLNRRYGKTKLIFDFQPERYLKSGENEILVASNIDLSQGTFIEQFEVINPYSVPAKPILNISGTGSVKLTFESADLSDRLIDFTVRFAVAGSNVTLDCKTHKVSEPSWILYDSLTKYPELPTLKPGRNLIAVSNNGVVNPGTLISLSVIPRWWSL